MIADKFQRPDVALSRTRADSRSGYAVAATASGMLLIWQSSLGPARVIDTLFVRKDDGKVVTQTGEWPLVSMTIDGRPLYGQAILQRTV